MSRRTMVAVGALVVVLVALVVGLTDRSDTARHDPARSLLLGPRESFAAAQGPFLPVFGGTELALYIIAGLAFVLSGAVAWRSRPHDLTGVLLVAAGLLWLVGGLRRSGDPVAFTVGVTVTNLYLPLLMQVVLGFPTGRLTHRPERTLVAAAWVAATVGVVAEWMFFDPRAVDTPHPSTSVNLLLIRHDPTVADAVQVTVGTVAVLLTVLLVVAVIIRFTRETAAYRAGFAPLGVAGAVAGVATIAILSVAVSPAGSPYAWILNLRYPAAALFPLAVVVGLVRYRLARAAVTDVMVDIGEAPLDAGFVDSLRRAVRDPGLQLWTYRDGTYVDADGTVAALPRDSATHAYAILERSGVPVAALVYDATLETQPELLASLRGAATLALDHDRLQRELREQLDEVRRSRERIVTAGDVQRKRLERYLHDGTQQRLVAASILLRRAQRSDDLLQTRRLIGDCAAEIDASLRELREVARGVYPPMLAERGLAVAVKSMAERAPIPVRVDDRLTGRVSKRIELAAYLIAAESVTNAVKHSGATSVLITLETHDETLVLTVRDDGCGGATTRPGGGIDGLADRASALGGALTLDSPRGRGTTLSVVLPLAPP